MLEPIREVLSFLFNDILAPIIGIFIQWAVNFLIYLLRIVFQELLVRLMVLLCRVVFLIEQMFKIFSGLAMVTANEYNGAALVKTTKMRLLDYFFQINGITTVLMAVTLVSVILTFLFAAYETAKSVNDVTLNEQNAKPVSVVLKNALKSMLGFGLIPVLCVTLLQFSAAILQSVIEVFAAPEVSVLKGGSADISTVIFYMAVQEAADESVLEKYRSGLRWQNADLVVSEFDLSKVNTALGILAALLIFLLLAGACLSCIKRIFDLLLLYLVSPYFAATISLDGGGKFKGWRELFIAKFFACFGSIFSMELFLILAPVISSSKVVTFFPDTTADNIARLFFIFGAAYAIFKGNILFMSILNEQEAQFEATQRIVAMLMGGAGLLMSFGGRGGAGGKTGQKEDGKDGKKGGKDGKDGKGGEGGKGGGS